MRICVLAAALAAAACAQAQTTEGVLFVSANTDIYRAHQYNDGSDGVAPFAWAFTAGPGLVLEFRAIIGSWTCADFLNGNPPYGPDGERFHFANGNCYPRANISNPIGPFSGYATTDFTGALVGLFTEDSLPGTAPPPLRFYISDSSQGGIPNNFAELSPQIGQVFFVGDGLTGTGSGAHQLFQVPATATRLYLGYVDSCGGSGFTSPSCFKDNGGAVTAFFGIFAQP